MSRRDPDNAADLVAHGARAAERGRPITWVRDWLRAAVLENVSLKLVALFLSLTMFILVQSDEDEFERVNVTLDYSSPRPGLTRVGDPPEAVRVTIKGSRRRLRRLKQDDLKDIKVTLTNTGEFVIQPEMIRPLPEGTEVASITPPSILLTYESTGDKSVSIRPRVVGSPADGFRIERIVASPETLDIRGAESAIARLEELSTQPLSIDGAKKTITSQVALAVPPFPAEVVVNDGLENPVSVNVTVKVEIVAAQFRVAVKARELAVLAAPGVSPEALAAWQLAPATVDLVLRGEESAVPEELDFESLEVGVVLNPADVIARVPRRAQVVVRGLPDGVAVLRTPGEVQLIPK